MHWRELLPFAPHRLRLTIGQRIHYLLGSVQWFGDLLTAAFTVLLLLTAAVTIFHHRLPVRAILGPMAVVPLLFLLTGVGRALWAIRTTSGCSFGDAVRCLRCWFALSWVVALACLRGLVRRRAAFLRTPKRKEGRSVWQAVRASQAESLIAVLAVIGAVAIVVSVASLGTVVLALLLVWLALQYSSAPWASFAAEGIRLTPLRAAYRTSSQSTGDWPQGTVPAALRIGLPAAFVGAVVAALLLATPTAPNQPLPPVDLPPIQEQVPNIPAVPAATPTQTPAPSPAPSATPTRTPTPQRSASASPSASATSSAGTPSAAPAPSP